MRRLICSFVVPIWLKQVFSWRGSYHVTCLLLFDPLGQIHWLRTLYKMDKEIDMPSFGISLFAAICAFVSCLTADANYEEEKQQHKGRSVTYQLVSGLKQHIKAFYHVMAFSEFVDHSASIIGVVIVADNQAKTQISLGILPVWSVFAVRSIGSQGPKVPSCRQWRLWSD